MEISELFPQSTAAVPDNLWKSESPLKRHAAAASLWLELTDRTEPPTLDKLSSSPEEVLAVDFQKVATSINFEV